MKHTIKNGVIHAPISTKPISSNKLQQITDSHPNVKKEGIFDKIKHGLKETGDFVKDHTIGEVEKAGSVLDKAAHKGIDNFKQNVSNAAHFASTEIKKGAGDLLHGAEAVESGLLPSGSSIIMESGLAVGGLAIIAILALKFF